MTTLEKGAGPGYNPQPKYHISQEGLNDAPGHISYKFLFNLFGPGLSRPLPQLTPSITPLQNFTALPHSTTMFSAH